MSLSLAILLAACGGGADAPAEAPEAKTEAAAKSYEAMKKQAAKKQGDHAGHGKAAGDTPFEPIQAEAKVYFATPEDGATVTNPVKVAFAVAGDIKVKPAGELAKNTGHHHLVIDGKPVPEGKVVPSDDQHIHYGKGQTTAAVELSPGTHTLTMQFADGLHRSYGPGFANTVTVTVEDSAE